MEIMDIVKSRVSEKIKELYTQDQTFSPNYLPYECVEK